MLFTVRNCYSKLFLATNLKLVNRVPNIIVCDCCTKMSSALEAVPKVDIDPSGVFKYILLNVYDKSKSNVEPIVIVRGYKHCNYHSDIYDEVQERLQPLDCEPLGGGRISNDAENKKMHIYGYSQGYGKADHELTAKLIKKAFPGYTITVSDEGY
ncbi:hypothetical protein PYW08_007321 [Mythimna loreyi]|uniref:Uncharacterized protein n=1 Tax=Mythimna loreyi TaxID=667449 RepID=A0ACC2R9C4_9NEOP|nr:hypothetical protein PYW08_007321 [Mythimna loreyi]